jgi:hypothetical protein
MLHEVNNVVLRVVKPKDLTDQVEYLCVGNQIANIEVLLKVD